MRLVLVDNLLLEQGGWTHHFDLQPHLGLISLIAVAEANGHQGILYDPKLAIARGELALDASLYMAMAEAIRRRKPDVVGFTTLGCNFICTLKVAAYLKRADPGLPIIVGGPHVSILHRQVTERFPQFDVVVRGEAEASLPRLLEGLRSGNLDEVPGVTFRHDNEIVETPQSPQLMDLDELPWPAFDHYPIEQVGLRAIRVEAGRGCPFDCTFCSTASFFGRRYRLKSSRRLVAELDFLHAQYGISEFALMHDLFTVSKAKVREFCDAVEDRGYGWRCSARMDCVDAELLARMRAAGCQSIYYGVETGSRRMQKIVSKHLDLDLYEPILDTTIALNMRPTASFITGYPEEEHEDQAQTLDAIGSSIGRYPESLTIQLHLLTPEPGTALIDQFGDRLAYDGHISDFNFPTLEPDDADLMAEHPQVFMNHHYYPGALPRRQHVFVTSAYLCLSQLGFVLLRYLLADFGGSLSRLIFAMQDWTDPSEPDRVDPDLIERFITRRDSGQMTIGCRSCVTGSCARSWSEGRNEDRSGTAASRARPASCLRRGTGLPTQPWCSRAPMRPPRSWIVLRRTPIQVPCRSSC
ncbi:B12-binding domain-containing radical SAM protein [Kribbella sp. VKM Ac-2566]|uniref:B12-binding domain-containing radical SAM protein n=1 Tax=Kribbella sp. VKM Ac-2566 TaxID=2512218 RepID=UPI001062576A|nr:radical SAM protein [Kribbella sp. VKM Ac-2566]TDW91134.1 radical SAM superfamily enzyme YgiQ (UPF0313 family) [Kribbella sp. VKM Ac-2566]